MELLCVRIIRFTSILLLWRICSADEYERRLYERLLSSYNVLERPVENNSMLVEVKLQIVLNQIIDVDEKNQVIQTNLWLRYEWTDFNLKWDPAMYGDTGDLRFPVGKIWRPDILLYNSVDQNFDSTYGVNHVVYSNGLVNWLPPGIVKSSCNIDITWFPFDEQLCHFKFGSWTYNGFKLDLVQLESGWDLSEYMPNGEWDLLNNYVHREVKKFDCCPEPYPTLFFYFKIRRRTLYYGFNMIIPSLLVSLMTLLGFALPVESGEKITLEITILLSVCVFLGMVASMTPPTSEALPLIGIFFSCNMILVSLSVVFSVIVLNLHYRTPDTHVMSPLMRSVMLNWLPWLLMMKRPGHKFTRKGLLSAFSNFSKPSSSPTADLIFGHNFATTNGGPVSSGGAVESESLMRNVRSSQDSDGIAYSTLSPSKLAPHERTDEDPPDRIRRTYSIDIETRLVNCLKTVTANPESMDQGLQGMLLTMQQIYAEIKFIAQRMEREDEVQDAKNDWRFAAMVVDRLCLVLFSAFIIISTCAIFFSAPHLIA